MSRSLLLGVGLFILSSLTGGKVLANGLFYSTSSESDFAANGPHIVSMEVSGNKVTFADLGPTHGGGCASLGLSPEGKLYSMCGDLFGNQQLATVDLKTGQADLFGALVPGLAVMSLAFGPDGTLYAVGHCDPDPAFTDCGMAPEPDYNSLYTVNTSTGEVTRVGSTGAPEYFMALAFDKKGDLLGVTSSLNPSLVPAVLYTINLKTGEATKMADLVGSNTVMGIAFGREGKLFANDFVNNPGLYLVDPKTGLEKAIAAIPFPLLSNMVLVNP